MSPTTVGVLGIIFMVVVFMTKMPVAYVMALVGFGGFAMLASLQGGFNLLAKDLYDVFSSYSLTTIPLFILMGQIAFNSGISSKLYASAYKFFGHTKGGLSIATVSACTAFGAVCGSSAATAATMATVGLPEMRKFGYSDALAAGSVSPAAAWG
jgi:C4-dicarboxylate transporter, DctM subunit